MKLNGAHELHLTVRETSLLPGIEWPSRFSNWLMLQADLGNGYWVHPKQTAPLEPGTVLVLPPESGGNIRAGDANGLSFSFFLVQPTRLMGLMKPAEQAFFRTASAREEFAARILSAQHPVSEKLRDLLAQKKQPGSLLRLQLLQKFIEAFGNELNREINEPEEAGDATHRLLEFLKTKPVQELIKLNFSELVQVSRCTPRHLTRIFREITGMSFREKRGELRLAQACELLATTDLKIVDVALESGFQSLSLFNLMFARRFGMSPGRWRQKNHRNKAGTTRRQKRTLWSHRAEIKELSFK